MANLDQRLRIVEQHALEGRHASLARRLQREGLHVAGFTIEGLRRWHPGLSEPTPLDA